MGDVTPGLPESGRRTDHIARDLAGRNPGKRIKDFHWGYLMAQSPVLTSAEKSYFEQLHAAHHRLWPAGVPEQACYPHGDVALVDYLRAWARQRGQQPVVLFYGAELTFAQLDDYSDRCAAVLRAHGVGAGDRVAVVLGNCPQFLIAFYGILKLGAVYVPVNPMYKEAELVFQLSDAQARAAIALDTHVPLLLSVKDRVGLEVVFATALGEMLPDRPELTLPPGLQNAYQPVEGALALLPALQACNETAPLPPSNPDAVAALNYTGGTTGLPKGCIHTQRDMVYTAATSNTVGGIIGPSRPGADPEDRTLNFLPMFWIAGENAGLVNPVFSGSTLVLLARWDALAVMEAIDRYEVRRCFLLVDNALEIMDHPRLAEFDLRSLQTTRVASFVRKLSIECRHRWQALTGSVMAEGAWGMTETHTSDTFTVGMQVDDQDLKGRPGFVGLPMPGTLIKICDFQTGALLPNGEEGEIVVSTPSLFKGYWRQPEATSEVMRDGWFHTGDIGAYDEQGYLHYLGRRKEMLKVRGMSVFPAEVEALVCLHPAVLDAAVVGRVDEQKGQVPVAFVRLRPEVKPSPGAAELEAWCREQMAGYKVPEIRIVADWPMTSTGKIKKHELLGRIPRG